MFWRLLCFRLEPLKTRDFLVLRNSFWW